MSNRDISSTSFKHISSRGCIITANRCDLRDGTVINAASGATAEDVARDYAQAFAYHALNIVPMLPGFRGYDAVRTKIIWGRSDDATKTRRARITASAIAAAATQVDDLKDLISASGGSLKGYLERYGSKDSDNHYGDGGEAIYAADIEALRQAQTNLDRLQKKNSG